MKFLVGVRGLGEKPNGGAGSRQEKSLSFRLGSRPFPSQDHEDRHPVHLVQVVAREGFSDPRARDALADLQAGGTGRYPKSLVVALILMPGNSPAIETVSTNGSVPSKTRLKLLRILLRLL